MDAQPMTPGQPARVSRCSIWSLALSLTGLFCIVPIGSIPAIILGHISLSSIRREGGTLGGRGYAIAGLVIGYAALVLWTVLIVLVLLFSNRGLSDRVSSRLKSLATPHNYMFIVESRDNSIPGEDIRSALSHRLGNAAVPCSVEARPLGEIEVRVAAGGKMSAEAIRKLLVFPGRLKFCLVDPKSQELSDEYAKDAQSFKCPAGLRMMETTDYPPGKEAKKLVYFVRIRPEMDGADIENSYVTLDPYGQRNVSFSLNSRGRSRFEQVTRENVGRQLGIIVDDKLYSAPVIKEVITGGYAVISGNFTEDDARRISAALVAPLPCAVTVKEEHVLDK